jgi:D-glycero-D-manno-heptose 1,7-bisphosphate phosphatase
MLYILIGYQGSTKSTFSKLLGEDTIVISRDVEGGKISDLIPIVSKYITEGKTVILDNTNLSIEVRKPFIEVAKKAGKEVHAVFMDTSLEDCQIRILHRQYQDHGQIFLTGYAQGIKDPHIFPIKALFAARNSLQKPTKEEGFNSIENVKVPPPRFPEYKNKALFLDIDGTIRATMHLTHKYPITEDEVVLITDKEKMCKKLNSYINEGYKLVGVSNQSGCSKNIITEEKAISIFNKTKELLGIDFPILFCPHNAAPISCYCRKPQSGMAMKMIEEWKLNPTQCIMVGDQTTDKTFAQRVGMKFIHVDKFW